MAAEKSVHSDLKLPDKEIQYIVTFDSEGNPLEGGRNYKLHLPPDVPARAFWSVIVYDSQSRLIIRTTQKWPSVYSSCKRHKVNEDGSVDVWFGPSCSTGRENNWIKTIPGKGWHMIMRLYEPTEAWFKKTWKPEEIKEIE